MNNLTKFNLLGLFFLSILTAGFASKSYAEDTANKAEDKVTKYNISANPIGIFAGVANFDIEWNLSENISWGPTVSYSDVSSNGIRGTALCYGAVLTLTPTHKIFATGAFLRPFVEYAVATANAQTATGLALGTNVGYWWFWKNGFNVGLGFGYQYLTMNLASLGLSAAGGRGTGLIQVGYSF
ncbi:MAG: hypothetical protein ABIQ95_06785 [Bdellovibrionia bacterium]